jgi:hypothetical protein
VCYTHFPFVNIPNPPEKRTLRALEKRQLEALKWGAETFLEILCMPKAKNDQDTYNFSSDWRKIIIQILACLHCNMQA